MIRLSHKPEEETLSIETLYRGRNFAFQKRIVRLPTGRKATREIVQHPGAVAIVPLLDRETIVLVEQYRTATGKLLLEIPAGTLNPPETPEDCANRELREETGYTAENLEHLVTGYSAPGYSTEKVHIYLATGLTYSGQRLEEDEAIQTQNISLKDLGQKILNGEVEDLKTVCGILRLLAQSLH
jgi:ADP-ribose pyrophosphatase